MSDKNLKVPKIIVRKKKEKSNSNLPHINNFNQSNTANWNPSTSGNTQQKKEKTVPISQKDTRSLPGLTIEQQQSKQCGITDFSKKVYKINKDFMFQPWSRGLQDMSLLGHSTDKTVVEAFDDILESFDEITDILRESADNGIFEDLVSIKNCIENNSLNQISIVLNLCNYSKKKGENIIEKKLDEKGNRAFHIAVINKSIAGIFDILAESMCEFFGEEKDFSKLPINLQNNEGNTPLHLAIMNGYIDIIESIFYAGNIFYKHINNLPIESQEDENILNLGNPILICNVNIKNNEGKNVIDLVRESGNEEIIGIFQNINLLEDEISYNDTIMRQLIDANSNDLGDKQQKIQQKQ